MLALIIGASGSGKSLYAEDLAVKAGESGSFYPAPEQAQADKGGRELIYLATMQPFGEEGRARIRRHRDQRKRKGFRTVECFTDLAGAPIPQGADVLLEDLSNLLANEMFSPERESEGLPDEARTAALDSVRRGIGSLCKTCRNLTIVTNDVFSGGSSYEGDTLVYLHHLATLNREIAARADLVVEVVCSIPNLLKGKRQVVPRGISRGITLENPLEITPENPLEITPENPLVISKEIPLTISREIHRECFLGVSNDSAEPGGPVGPFDSVDHVDSGKNDRNDQKTRVEIRAADERRNCSMIFVIGPLYSGKREYIRKALGMDEESFASCAVWDVQELVSSPVSGKTASRKMSVETEALAENPETDCPEGAEKSSGQEVMGDLTALADRLAKKRIVIATEIGGGVVPVDPAERAKREAAGRLACLLAARADTVIRVCCGLPQLLKGEWP